MQSTSTSPPWPPPASRSTRRRTPTCMLPISMVIIILFKADLCYSKELKNLEENIFCLICYTYFTFFLHILQDTFYSDKWICFLLLKIIAYYSELQILIIEKYVSGICHFWKFEFSWETGKSARAIQREYFEYIWFSIVWGIYASGKSNYLILIIIIIL